MHLNAELAPDLFSNLFESRCISCAERNMSAFSRQRERRCAAEPLA
jgi:hypothetical protein